MEPGTDRELPRGVVFGLLGAAWLTLFAVLFYATVIWANGLQLPRLAILFDLSALLAANFQPSPGASWSHLPQRFDLLAIAGVVLAAAWGQGAVVLAKLAPASGGRKPAETTQRLSPAPECFTERLVLTFGIGLSTWSLTTLLLGCSGVLTATPFWVVATVSVAGGAFVSRRRGPTDQSSDCTGA